MNPSDPGAQDATIARDLEARIRAGTVTVGVVGLGYVGLPLAHAMHESGVRVLGFDVDSAKVDAIAAGHNYLKHLGDEMVEGLRASDRFEGTTDFGRLGEADAVLVCVPTPLGAHHDPDLGYVLRTASTIGAALRPGQLLVLESTTYPGTTRDDFLPAVMEAAARAGTSLEPGRDFFVAYSPEREDPGRKSHSISTVPKVVGGIDPDSTALARALYERCVDQVHTVSSPEVAEASKLLENIFRAVNIALVNEMKAILDGMDIDIWEVVDAAATKPFGFMPFYPGPGLGGHCIPIDPFYLSWKAKELGHPTRFIELAGEINTNMPAFVVRKVALALNDRSMAVRGARVLVIGLAYKADVDDTRESPSFELIEELRGMGAHVDYSDPHIPRTIPTRRHDLGLESVELTADSVAAYDAVLIATAHSSIDYALIAEHARLVVDTRNAMARFASSMGDRLVRA